MRTSSNVTVIDILWEGPYSIDRVKEQNKGHDYGIYQVYGTHPVFGPDALLYIGHVDRNKFGDRFISHQRKWLELEPSETQIFIGRLSGVEPLLKSRNAEWGEMIVRAEALLIYYCSPPFNAKEIKEEPNVPETVVINHGRRNRLPRTVSNVSAAISLNDLKPYSDEGFGRQDGE
jgi:hypothetical protein